MGHYDSPLSYEELLRAFKEAINSVLAGAVLPPISALFDVPLTLALLDVAHAVREERPTEYLVARACAAFATYAADYEARQAPQEARVLRIEAGI
jgi:hypothetical protein